MVHTNSALLACNQPSLAGTVLAASRALLCPIPYKCHEKNQLCPHLQELQFCPTLPWNSSHVLVSDNSSICVEGCQIILFWTYMSTSKKCHKCTRECLSLHWRIYRLVPNLHLCVFDSRGSVVGCAGVWQVQRLWSLSQLLLSHCTCVSPPLVILQYRRHYKGTAVSCGGRVWQVQQFSGCDHCRNCCFLFVPVCRHLW